ncbi:MAG: hypothetical protein ACOC2W_02400 [bacterium]
MSEDETYYGEIVEIQENESSLRNKIFNILDEKQKEKFLTCDDVKEFFYDEDLYKKYVIANNKLYQILHCVKTDGFIFAGFELEDKRIGFVVSYYNGGCSFEEAIESAIMDSEGGL